ncbi:hypothetical protein M0Q50_05205 [bacterium]|jgi:hypothetical protein|nr:hypothetical protein [bacterium]
MRKNLLTIKIEQEVHGKGCSYEHTEIEQEKEIILVGYLQIKKLKDSINIRIEDDITNPWNSYVSLSKNHTIESFTKDITTSFWCIREKYINEIINFVFNTNK